MGGPGRGNLRRAVSTSDHLSSAAGVRFCLEKLVGLLAHHEPSSLASDALSTLNTHFGASAGSLFCAARPRVCVRHGELSPQVAAQIDRWEASIEGRLAAGPWQIGEPEGPALASQPIGSSGYVALYSLIHSNRRVVGGLFLAYRQREVPTGPQRALLALFVQAISRIFGLLGELSLASERLGQLSLLYQVSQSMASTFELATVLEDTLQLAAAVSDASTSALLLIEQESGDLVVEYAHGERSDRLVRQRTALGEGIAGWVAAHGEPILNNHVRSDPRFASETDAFRGLLIKSVLCLPVQIRGKTIGVLEVLNKRGAAVFDGEDLSLLITTASQAAIAIENAWLYQSLRDERDRIIEAQEVVRHQVARNLHDGTIQFLSAISMGIDHLERLLELKPEAARSELQALRDLTRQATTQARLALFELRPVILETQGLVAALETYVHQLGSSEAFAIHLDAEPRLPKLGNSIASTVFAIIQEAVTNAKKHAAPRDMWLRLSQADGWLQVVVEDNGTGFDPEIVDQTYDRRCSMGLLSMRERAELIEGHLTIESCKSPPDNGTRVILRLPVRRELATTSKQQRDEREVL
jgi:signal transduction histidine kinase